MVVEARLPVGITYWEGARLAEKDEFVTKQKEPGRAGGDEGNLLVAARASSSVQHDADESDEQVAKTVKGADHEDKQVDERVVAACEGGDTGGAWEPVRAAMVVAFAAGESNAKELRSGLGYGCGCGQLPVGR